MIILNKNSSEINDNLPLLERSIHVFDAQNHADSLFRSECKIPQTDT